MGTVIFREELDLAFAQFANPTLDRRDLNFVVVFTCTYLLRASRSNVSVISLPLSGRLRQVRTRHKPKKKKKKKIKKKQHTQVFYCSTYRQKHTLNGNKTRFNHLEKLYTISIVIYSKYHLLMQLTHRHGWISMLIPETSSQSIFFFFGICHQITVDTKRVTLRICQKKKKKKERQQIENKTVI